MLIHFGRHFNICLISVAKNCRKALFWAIPPSTEMDEPCSSGLNQPVNCHSTKPTAGRSGIALSTCSVRNAIPSSTARHSCALSLPKLHRLITASRHHTKRLTAGQGTLQPLLCRSVDILNRTEKAQMQRLAALKKERHQPTAVQTHGLIARNR